MYFAGLNINFSLQCENGSHRQTSTFTRHFIYWTIADMAKNQCSSMMTMTTENVVKIFSILEQNEKNKTKRKPKNRQWSVYVTLLHVLFGGHKYGQFWAEQLNAHSTYLVINWAVKLLMC